MDEAHLVAVLRYTALNLVRAGLTVRAVDWQWSSVHTHIGGVDDGITAGEPGTSRYPDFAALLAAGEDEARVMRSRNTEQVGRPIGDRVFLDRLEGASGRSFKPGRPGPEPRSR
jgi:putative transposase